MTEAEELEYLRLKKKQALAASPQAAVASGQISTEDFLMEALRGTTSRVQAFGQGASFGLSDDMGAVLDNAHLLFDQSNELGEDTRTFPERWEDFADTEDFAANRASRKANRDKFAEENPGEAFMLELAGGIVGPGVPGAAAALKGANTLGQVASRGAAIGAAEGALFGYGLGDDSDPTADPVVKSVLQGSLLGGGGGALIGSAAHGLRTGLRAYKANKAKGLEMRDNHALVTQAEEEAAEFIVANPDADPSKVTAYVMSRLDGETEALTNALKATGRRLGDLSPTQAKLIAEHRRAAKRPLTPTSWTEGVSKGLDYYGGALSTRIKHIHRPTFELLRKHDKHVHKKTADYMGRMDGIEKLGKRKYKDVQPVVARLLSNDKFDEALDVIDKLGDKELSKSWRNVRGVLDDVRKEQLNTMQGADIPTNPNYFPRMVKDVNELRRKLGTAQKNKFDEALKRFANKRDKSVSDLTDRQREAVYNQTIRSGGVGQTGAGKLGNSKARTIEYVGEGLQDEYHDPVTAITRYVSRAVEDAEERAFFNKNYVPDADVGGTDVRTSVGKLLQDSNLTPDKEGELAEMLNARFGVGKEGPGKIASRIKNIGLMTALGNPKSAAIQIADLGHSAYVNGIRNTARAMLPSGRTAKTDVLGLQDIVQAEFNDVDKTMLGLKKLLKWSGFKSIDRFGKETLISSSLNKHRMMANGSAPDRARIVDKWKDTFTDAEMGEFMDALRVGDTNNEHVQLMLWHELSDIQPISLSEMPEAYLKAKNGRLLYSLKSFALKQMDIVRRQIVHEYKTGSKAKAKGNAVRFALLTGGSAAMTNEMRQWLFSGGADPIRPEDIPEEVVWQWIGTSILVNKYSTTKAGKTGDISSALASGFMPPLGMIGGALGDAAQYATGNGAETLAETNTVATIPWIGRIISDFAGKGNERKRKRAAKEDSAF